MRLAGIAKASLELTGTCSYTVRERAAVVREQTDITALYDERGFPTAPTAPTERTVTGRLQARSTSRRRKDSGYISDGERPGQGLDYSAVFFTEDKLHIPHPRSDESATAFTSVLDTNGDEYRVIDFSRTGCVYRYVLTRVIAAEC